MDFGPTRCFPSTPEIVDDFLIVDATTAAGGLAVLVQFDGVESADVDLDCILGVGQRVGRAMAFVYCEKWDTVFACVRHLYTDEVSLEQ